MQDRKALIIAEAKRLEEDCLYSSKGHFEAAVRWGHINMVIGLAGVLAGALAAVFTLSKADWLVIALAVLVSASSAVLTFLHPDRTASSHHNAGTAYNALRNRMRLFYTITCTGDTPMDDLATQVQALSEERNTLNQQSLPVPAWAFKRARRGIEEGEATYAVDKAQK